MKVDATLPVDRWTPALTREVHPLNIDTAKSLIVGFLNNNGGFEQRLRERLTEAGAVWFQQGNDHVAIQFGVDSTNALAIASEALLLPAILTGKAKELGLGGPIEFNGQEGRKLTIALGDRAVNVRRQGEAPFVRISAGAQR